MQKVEPSVVMYWRLSRSISTVVTSAILLVVVAPTAFAASVEAGLWALVILAVLVVAHLGWVLITAGMRYERLRFSTEGGVLRVRHGVLIHTEKLIPIARMQHVDIDRGPLERLFGLASIAVFTAGGRAATFRVPGLSPERAQGLRALLLGEVLEGALERSFEGPGPV